MRTRKSVKMNEERAIKLIVGVVLMMLLSFTNAVAEELPYLCDFGLQGGVGYYIGDVPKHKHLFVNPREVYGLQFRYKFNNRWAVQVKGQFQRLAIDTTAVGTPSKPDINNGMINIDAVGEFNFFRYGEKSFDARIKPITPYLFLGLGFAFYGPNAYGPGHDYSSNFAMYLPIGIGMKWRFAPRWQMVAAWQHNLYLGADRGDGVELQPLFGNTHNMNGSNFFNYDLTGQLTVGIVFEFAQQKGACRTCSWN